MTVETSRLTHSRQELACALGLCALLHATACSDSGTSSTSPSDAGSDGVAAVGSDALSRGRWERVFSGENGDWPNSEPRLDLDASGAHLLYTAKASNLKYYWFPFAGSPEAVPIPTTVKNPGRIVVTSTRTVILTRETFNGDTGTLFVNGSSVVAGPAPFPARLTRSDLTATRVGDDVLTLEGETVRRVPRYEGNGFRDLGAPSAPALVGLTAAAVDGARTFFVEYQGDNRSTV